MSYRKGKDSCNKYLGFNDHWFWIIGVPLVSLLSPIAFFMQTPFQNPQMYWIGVVVNVVYCSVFWHIDRGIIVYFRKKFPNFRDTKKRIFISSLVVLFITVGIYLLSFGAVDNWMMANIENCVAPPASQGISAAITITIIVITIYESIYFVKKWQDSINNYERLKKVNAQSQLESLKNQVNPHFLFNSLNTLASIIPENKELSVKFVEELSAVYRCILEIRNKDMVSLQEELTCLESYIFLLNIRFGENLKFVHAIEEGKLDHFVVPLSLQLLVENAIKHNVASKTKTLTIEISTEQDKIFVKNNKQAKKSNQVSTQMGLNNINERYRMLIDKEIEIFNSEETFKVEIPLIQIFDNEDSNN